MQLTSLKGEMGKVPLKPCGGNFSPATFACAKLDQNVLSAGVGQLKWGLSWGYWAIGPRTLTVASPFRGFTFSWRPPGVFLELNPLTEYLNKFSLKTVDSKLKLFKNLHFKKELQTLMKLCPASFWKKLDQETLRRQSFTKQFSLNREGITTWVSSRYHQPNEEHHDASSWGVSNCWRPSGVFLK